MSDGGHAQPAAPRARRPEHTIRVLHVFPSFAMGGVQGRIADVANRLPDGFDHLCVALDGRADARNRLWPDTRWRFVAAPRPGGLRSLAAAWAAERKLAPDVVCTYNWGAIEWAFASGWLGRSGHLHFESGFGPDEADAPLPRRSLARRVALARARRLVVPSQQLRRLARSRGWVSATRLVHIPNGVDVDWYSRARVPDDRPAGIGGGIDCVAVAPLRAEKRLDRLVRALAPEPSCRSLTLVGDGPENERLARLAAELDVRDKVLLVGARADVRPALARADLFAMTSETEQMPNALLQAMSMSLPVVAHEAGDIWEILPDVQRPFVSPQGDLGRLAEAVRVLAHRPDRRQALAAANRVRVRETYPMNAMVNRYRELYALAAEAA